MVQQINAYLDIGTFQAMGLGLDISGLVGLNAVLTSPQSVGTTTLNVTVSGGLLPSQPVYILDGPNTEIVFAATSPTNPTPSSTSIVIQSPGLAYAHNANVSVSSPGTLGTLGQIIIAASGWVEGECKQGTLLLGRSLFSTTRTEKLRMPTTRAYITSYRAVEVRPHFFPVSAVSALSVETAPGNNNTMDASQLELDATGRLATFPAVQAIGNPFLWGPPVNRRTQAWCNITYTAGLTFGALPWDFQQAVAFAIQEFATYAQNPTGAAMIRQEQVEVIQRLRGKDTESTADSIFLIQAKNSLINYRAQAI